MSYTKGPWEAKFEEAYSIPSFRIWNVYTSGSTSSIAANNNPIRIGADRDDEHEAEDNAHLVAAAPALLEAAQQVLSNRFRDEMSDALSALSEAVEQAVEAPDTTSDQ